MPKDTDAKLEDEAQEELERTRTDGEPEPSEEDVEDALADQGAKPATEEDTDKLQRNTEVID